MRLDYAAELPEASRAMASRPSSLMGTLTKMFGATFAKWRPSREHAHDLVSDDLGAHGTGRDLADPGSGGHAR